MREEEANWFSKWEKDLPSPEELMPLSQSLITPDLALAFDIRTPINASDHNPNTINIPQSPLPNQPNQNMPISMPNLGGTGPLAAPSSAEFAADSGELGSGGATGDEPARTLKRPRLVWTPQLHKRFVDAVAHLGIKNAVPKTIMQLMSVDGLTRENVASHLQKYRLYLKRMQGLSGGAGGGGAGAGGNGGGGGGSLVAAADPATEHLFASGPVPPHFLHPGGGRGSSEHFMPYVPVAALQQQQQQMVAAAAAAAAGQHPQYHRPVGGGGHYGQFEHAFVARQGVHRMGAPMHGPMQNYVEDLESGNAHGGRKVLTLFPTGDE